MNKSIKYRHRVNSGDLLASMAGMKNIFETSGRKGIIYQDLGVLANYYAGAIHPITDKNGRQVTMSKTQWALLKPLLLSQEYIESVEIYKGQKVDVDLDRIRMDAYANIPYGMIQSWIFYAFPDMACDLCKKWIDGIEPNNLFSGKIILNFTERYRNNTVTYFFLKKYKDNLIFSGTKDECASFSEAWNLNIPYLEIDNFLELAQIIKASKFVLSNQSTVWNIANAMMHPRLLEVCNFAPNCQPFIGEKNYGFFNQFCLEYFFKKLNT